MLKEKQGSDDKEDKMWYKHWQMRTCMNKTKNTQNSSPLYINTHLMSPLKKNTTAVTNNFHVQ